MVFAPVSQEIREKVIGYHLAGHGRNKIDRLLNEQGVKVSHGSISNIIARYRREQSSEQPTSIQQQIADTSSNPPIVEEEQVNNTNTDDQEIDFADQEYETASEALLSGEYDPALDGEQGERLLGFEQGVDITDTQNDSYVTKENAPSKEKKFEQSKSESELSHIKNSPTLAEDTETENLDLGINWDNSHHYQSRFMKRVMQEKRNIQNEKDMLALNWNRLQEERKKFGQFTEMKEKDLQIREATLAQVKDLISTAAELKEFGLDFDIANSWLSCVKEMSLRKGLDMRQAAWKLAEDLKNWQELGGFETAISNAKHQLELLGIAIEERRAAISTLVDLRKSGMTEDNIMNLTRVVNGWGNGNGSGFKLDTSINGQGENSRTLLTH